MTTQSHALNFDIVSMNVLTFIHNCNRLGQILNQYVTVNVVELDITALAIFVDDDDSPITEINTSNAFQHHSKKSVITACYSYFSSALSHLRRLVKPDGQRTPMS